MLGSGHRLLWILALSGSLFTGGCRRKEPADFHTREGYRLLESNPKAALKELDQAHNPSDPEVLLGRGLALEALRRPAEAETVLHAACTAKGELLCWLALGRVQVALGKLDAARAAIDQVVSRDQTELAAVLLCANLANDAERARTALGHLKKWGELAHARKPPLASPAELHLTRAALHRQLEMRAEFDVAKQQAKKAQLSQARGVLWLVEVAARTGRSGLAIELLRRIEAERPPQDVRRQVAKLAHGLGEHRLAGDILDTLQGSDVEFVTLRAEHALATGRPEAATLLRDAIRLTTDDAEKTRLRFLLSEAQLRAGDFEAARAGAEQVLKVQPSDEAVLLLARLDVAQDQPGEAIERLAPLLAKPRVPLEARELAVRAHLALQHRHEARSLLDAILLEQPTQAQAARLRVALEVDSGKPADAVRVAEQLVVRAPEDPGLRLLLAEAVQKAQGARAAAQSLRQSVRALPGDARLWLALVRTLEESKAGSEVLAALEEAHQTLPGEVMLTAALAGKLAKAGGQAERAASLYQEVIRSAERDPIALNNLAMIYADELDEPSQAVTLAERAHALSPTPPIVDTLAWSLYRRRSPGDLERARQLLESISGALDSPETRYHLGAVLMATGAVSEGKALLSQALRQAADFPGAEQARSLLMSAPE